MPLRKHTSKLEKGKSQKKQAIAIALEKAKKPATQVLKKNKK